MDWLPRLITPNPFGRDVLLEINFDPLNDIPYGLEKTLLDDAWGRWILQQKNGERIRRSLDKQDWLNALESISRTEIASSPYFEAIQLLDEHELSLLFQYLRKHHLSALDHLAAVRSILMPDGLWIWCIGICHDEILARSGSDRLLARFRNQRTFNPRIEFEPDAKVASSLLLLIDEGFSLQDFIDIEAGTFRATSIGEALRMLGYTITSKDKQHDD